jgi:hypothetical protein
VDADWKREKRRGGEGGKKRERNGMEKCAKEMKVWKINPSPQNVNVRNGKKDSEM